MATLFTNATDITPGAAGIWVDIDVSAYCPTGTTGVILQVINTGTTSYAWGIRKPGSTDARTFQTFALSQTWGYIGVDSNRVFQGYTGNVALQFKLLGYFTSDGGFFTNAHDKTPGTYDTWIDVDCSALIPSGAKFAIVELYYGDGLRPKGSTDDRKSQYTRTHGFALVGLDANRVFQAYRNSGVQGNIYLVGYLTLGTPKTNGVDVSLSSTGAYVNIDRSGDTDASEATGVLVEVYNINGVYDYALRKNGSTDDFYRREVHVWGVVGLDSNKIFQGKIADTNQDFFIMGYLASPPPPTYTYATALSLVLTLQSVYGFPQIFTYIANVSLSPLLQGVYSRVWTSVSSLQASLLPQSTYFKGWESVVSLLLDLMPQGDYFAILGRGAIPGPYILRYPNPKNGQTNVPKSNPIKFIVKSDGPGVNIDTVKVKVTDSWGVNIYDKTSPYFQYSGKKSRYEVEVRPPQPWAYEENVQTEIEAEDLNGTPGMVYEYVP
ncbi:MAG: hypothetical protein QMD05_09285 [Candidatus Brocadiaceae bacterium]|nr:hypothetical protein [Candidatus Brocadiaceae bacterium]